MGKANEIYKCKQILEIFSRYNKKNIDLSRKQDINQRVVLTPGFASSYIRGGVLFISKCIKKGD